MANGKTGVLFFFDTEDFTCERSMDAIRDLAELFEEEGVRAHFAITGYVARQLVQWGRTDVLEALKGHVIGTHTLYHSVHPDICEISDTEDFEEGYRNVLIQESEAVGMVKAATGAERILFAVPPGNCKSYAAMYAYADMGIPFYCDTVIHDMKNTDCVYCNARHMEYVYSWENMLPGEETVMLADRLEDLARRDYVIVYAHPHLAVHTQHWDAVNYQNGNLVEWGKWKEAPRRSEEDTAEYYRRIREGIRMLKNDPRFYMTDLEKMEAAGKARTPITKKDIPFIRKQLQTGFGAIKEPSWCLYDIFTACVRFLSGEESYLPGNAYGFLKKPESVCNTVKLQKHDIIRTARGIRTGTFLQETYLVGDVRVGPADLLMAMLEVLDTDADTVTVQTKEQLGSMEHLPELGSFRIAGSWVHTPEFRDAYLSDRLRLQLWTFRYV